MIFSLFPFLVRITKWIHGLVVPTCWIFDCVLFHQSTIFHSFASLGHFGSPTPPGFGSTYHIQWCAPYFVIPASLQGFLVNPKQGKFLRIKTIIKTPFRIKYQFAYVSCDTLTSALENMLQWWAAHMLTNTPHVHKLANMQIGRVFMTGYMRVGSFLQLGFVVSCGLQILPELLSAARKQEMLRVEGILSQVEIRKKFAKHGVWTCFLPARKSEWETFSFLVWMSLLWKTRCNDVQCIFQNNE